MARKKIEPITSLGNEDKLTVQKSLPLFSLWQSDLTLAEFKILDTYLSRIDSHKPEKRAVIFDKGELEKILGVKKINNQDLVTRLKHLMGNVIQIPDVTMKKGIKFVTLFEEAIAEQDDYGIWQIKLSCTQKAMKYFFNIENLGYLRYKLRCITSLTSRYTYIMFIYLEANRYRKNWNVSLAEIKQILDCDKVETYSAFKEFNKQVLKKVQTELFNKTECRYTYEPVKKGRSVVSINFTVETLSDNIALKKSEETTHTEINYNSELSELLSESCNNEFRDSEIRVIQDLVLQATQSNDHVYLSDYLSNKIHVMNLYDHKKKINNRFMYLCSMIKKDIKG